MKVTHTARRWLALVAAALVLTLAACSASTTDSSPAMGGDSMAVEAADFAEGGMAEVDPELLREQGSPEAGDGSMLIVNKTMRLQVTAADDAVDEIRRLAAAREGSITDMEVASDDGWVHPRDGGAGALRGWVVVRVPAAGYDAFVADVAALGEVLSQSESSSDVTQQHVDLSARLANLRSQEERLRDFFDAAEGVEEMLLIEKELGRVRGDIESLDAQVTHLERQAAMVTVTIHLTEPDAVVSPAGDSWGFREAVTSGLRGAVALLNGAVAFLIATAPVWIVGLVAYLPVRAWLRRRRATVAAPVAD